jgi:hypothetical protein
MKNVYLVQRLNKPLGETNPFSFGGGLKHGGLSDEAMSQLKDIFSFDYMGSAEFEFGALPRAFTSLTTIELTKFTIDETNIPIYVISPVAIQNDVKQWIINAAKSEPNNLKERLELNYSLILNDPFILGWIKIENEHTCTEPFMFFIDETMFTKTCELFNVK